MLEYLHLKNEEKEIEAIFTEGEGMEGGRGGVVKVGVFSIQ